MLNNRPNATLEQHATMTTYGNNREHHKDTLLGLNHRIESVTLKNWLSSYIHCRIKKLINVYLTVSLHYGKNFFSPRSLGLRQTTNPNGTHPLINSFINGFTALPWRPLLLLQFCNPVEQG
jgi:hypothetical protein